MATIGGTCLCGEVAWETTEAPGFMSHCHCARCRKAHGSAFATYCMVPVEAFRLLRGRERLARWQSSPDLFRTFCDRCGTVVPDGEPSWGRQVFVPVGPFDDDPITRPAVHIFAGSKAPWFEIADDLPRFDAFPPGVDSPVIADRPSPVADASVPRGSCLCSGVAYVMPGAPLRAYNCHCSRCRKARGAAHASNLFTAADGVRFVQGQDLLASYKVPDARYFGQVFCRVCGSPMPRIDRERNLAIVPMGSLDDAPAISPQRHIFTASKAPWYDIPDALPQHAEYPPSS